MAVDLTTRYLGLELANPIVPSASTLSQRSDTLKRLEAAGASAIVMQSLFEEQIEREELEIHHLLETGAESFAEATTYLPELEDYNVGPDAYLRHLEQTKQELRIPVIGSLNGSSDGGWPSSASPGSAGVSQRACCNPLIATSSSPGDTRLGNAAKRRNSQSFWAYVRPRQVSGR